MVGRSGSTALVAAVDRSSPVPLHRQLYAGLREHILAGRLVGGTRLPSTRELAAELGVSRNTVMTAFRQLLAEGYLEGKAGSGTYVTGSLPEDLLRTRVRQDPEPPRIRAGRRLSRRGEDLASIPAAIVRDLGPPRAFRPGLPALDEFPLQIWQRLVREVCRRPRDLLGYGDPAGYRPLREEISDYLRAARAVRCRWEQVIVVSGSQQALDLTARVLLDPGDKVWVEDPGYGGARGALISAGADPVPVPVDDEGLDVEAGMALDTAARLACVTPSHQYPLGKTMSLPRRLAQVDWAPRHAACGVEADYDSEYRYGGRPLEALQGLDAEGRVIYAGTFSKVLFPSLRLGYLVVPPDLVDPFTTARELADRHSPVIEQAVLARFISEGHFARHIRRMRKLYAERQAALVGAAARDLSALLEVRPAKAGMHLVGWLPEDVDDLEASRHAAAEGLETPALTRYETRPSGKKGLLLGYAAVTEQEIQIGVRRLARALRTMFCTSFRRKRPPGR
ncbi:MAG: PLP-dependent aminotransferase family protein [Rubrobacteraceae bacterium]